MWKNDGLRTGPLVLWAQLHARLQREDLLSPEAEDQPGQQTLSQKNTYRKNKKRPPVNNHSIMDSGENLHWMLNLMRNRKQDIYGTLTYDTINYKEKKEQRPGENLP